MKMVREKTPFSAFRKQLLSALLIYVTRKKVKSPGGYLGNNQKCMILEYCCMSWWNNNNKMVLLWISSF